MCQLGKGKNIQGSPIITHLILTWIWIKHSHVVAPIFFYHGILQRNCRKMEWSFSYNFFVKLSLYYTIRLQHGLFLWSPKLVL